MKTTKKEPFLTVIRELARTFQAFEQLSSQHIRTLDLTPPQFDVIATLGNTSGMNCKELSEKTLITKGTLTGVIDRLADKGLVERLPLEHDRRSVVVALTPNGEALFQRIFPAHLAHMRRAFTAFSTDDLNELATQMAVLRQAFNKATESAGIPA